MQGACLFLEGREKNVHKQICFSSLPGHWQIISLVQQYLPILHQSLVPLFLWVSALEASPVYKTYIEYIHMPSPTNLSFVVESHMEKDIFFPWWHI